MSTTPGLRKRGSMVVRLSLAFMVVLFLAASAVRLTKHHDRVVTVTANVTEFYASPDQVSCEFDHHPLDSTAPWQIYCEYATSTSAFHVTMTSTGVTHTCSGMSCGSNAGLGTPTYRAHTRVVGGPITCTVIAHGVTCTLPGGTGFVMTPTSFHTLHA